MFFPPQTQSGLRKASMPTAAKLVAGILFFLVGWQAAVYTLLTFPPEMPATYFPLTIGLIGLWQGWMVSGSRAGQGIGVAFGNGIRCSVQIAFFGILLFALAHHVHALGQPALQRPVGGRDGDLRPLYRVLHAVPDHPRLGTLLIGGALCGLVVEAAGRLWR
jgi:hypothetical protein